MRAKRKGGQALAKAKFDRAYGLNGRRGEAVRRMRCVTQSTWEGRRFKCSGKPEASHASARGNGGVKGDSGQLVPQCTGCHRWWGRDPRGYETACNLSMEAEAAKVKALLDERFGPEPCYKCGETNGHTLLCKTAEGRRVARETTT